MSRPTPRRPASSRGAVNRPRKIAGRSGATGPVDEPAGSPVEEPVDTAGRDATPDREVAPPQGAEPDGDRPATALASPAASRLLLVILAVLAVVLLAQLVWWVRHEKTDDPSVSPTESCEQTGPIAAPSDTPVVENELAWKEGVDVAAQAVQAMSTRSWETYDADVDAAVEFLTDCFAEQFRTTTDDVKDSFVAKKAVMGVEIRAQSVVRANDAELQALVLFDQSTVTAAGGEPKTVRSAYRALVTLVHTDQGWFVDRLEAS